MLPIEEKKRECTCLHCLTCAEDGCSQPNADTRILIVWGSIPASLGFFNWIRSTTAANTLKSIKPEALLLSHSAQCTRCTSIDLPQKQPNTHQHCVKFICLFNCNLFIYSYTSNWQSLLPTFFHLFRFVFNFLPYWLYFHVLFMISCTLSRFIRYTCELTLTLTLSPLWCMTLFGNILPITHSKE